MKNKMLTALLVTAAVMVAACGSQPATHRSATPTPKPVGIITEFPLPDPNGEPGGITRGPDGNLWFVEDASNKIGRITLTGQFTEFPLHHPIPIEITAGPDGNLWFTECVVSSSACTNGQIGRITSGK